MVYARSGDSINAYELLKKAYEVEPESPQVNFNMALIEAELGQLDESEKHLRVVLKVQPDMAQAAYNLGVLLCQQKKEEGYEWLRNAAELVPENWEYLSSYLYFLDQAGREAEIEAALKEAVATGRAPAEAYFTLAANYQNEGALPAAAEIYRKATFAKQLDMDAKRYAKRMEQVIRAMMEQ